MEEKALRDNVAVALKTAIAAGAGTPVTDGVDGGATRMYSHTLYSFACSYYVKIGDRKQLRQADVWVTAPSRGNQHSACFRFGK